MQYRGLYNGVDYQPVNDDGGGSQRIEVASWIVYYENSSGGMTITSQNIESDCDKKNTLESFSLNLRCSNQTFNLIQTLWTS